MASNFTARGAEGYEKIMGRFSRKLTEPFLRFTGYKPGERMLDVGSGTGALTFALAGRGEHAGIVGIDVAEPYVAFARARNTDPRVTFEIADATSLPFPNGHFDRAVSQLVLQFLPDPRTALAEMRRVVKPGGLVAASVWDGYGGLPHMRMLWDTASALGLDRTTSLIRPLMLPGEMEEAWRKAGLTAVVQDQITIRFEFENFDDYWSPFLSGDGPSGKFVAGLAPPQRRILQDQMRHVFLSGRPDGRRSFVGAAWCCKGIAPAT